MTATNHALTGAIIGLTVGNPWLAIPLAFASHFVLDALPHYGPAKSNIGSKRFRNYLTMDAALCILLVLLLGLSRSEGWIVAALCAFVATSPDVMWLPDFLRARQGKSERTIANRNAIVRFHSLVQWYQKPPGAIIFSGTSHIYLLH
jgi:hypothetical protein